MDYVGAVCFLWSLGVEAGVMRRYPYGLCYYGDLGVEVSLDGRKFSTRFLSLQTCVSVANFDDCEVA